MRRYALYRVPILVAFVLSLSFLFLQASERELQIVIRISVLLVGLAGLGLAFGDDSVFALWMVSGDLLYCVVLPQLVCVLYFSRANSYGAICGYLVGLLVRGLSGEPLLGIPALILYPGWREVDGVKVQYFPFRTIAMLSSMICIISVSWLVEVAFRRQIIPQSWDSLGVFDEKKEAEKEQVPAPCEENNSSLNTKL